MNRLPPLFVVLRKAFDPEFKRQMEEARKKHEKIEAEYQASKKPSPSLPPMGGSKKPNIHHQAAYHIAHIHAIAPAIDLDVARPGERSGFQEKIAHHRRIVNDLIKQGAKPTPEHFRAVGRHFKRKYDQLSYRNPIRSTVGAHDHAYRVSYAAFQLGRNPDWVRNYTEGRW